RQRRDDAHDPLQRQGAQRVPRSGPPHGSAAIAGTQPTNPRGQVSWVPPRGARTRYTSLS
ncbi:MAG: hypothetical protein ACM362_09425, partial [Candidatus Methylomirabilota bacterium]